MADAISSGRPMRPSGVIVEKNARAPSASSLVLNWPSMIGVSIGAGRQRVDADAAILQFHRPGSREGAHRGLGRGIGTVLGQALQMQAEDTSTIEPPLRISGSAFCTVK